jgi:UDP-2-acetamido-3-amino-2,3-dideoxy-glucuronate N-acetyltransferase
VHPAEFHRRAAERHPPERLLTSAQQRNAVPGSVNEVVTEATIHPTAIVEADVSIGEGSAVWHHCHIRSGARIGASVSLGKNVYVDAGVSIGDGTRIQNNVAVYAGVTLGERVFVGPSATFTNDLYPRADTPDWELVPTTVHDGASIGANSTIVCGVTLGASCMVAAGSVVTRSVAPHQLVRGNPARPGGWVCRCGRISSRDADPPADPRCEQCRQDGRP